VSLYVKVSSGSPPLKTVISSRINSSPYSGYSIQITSDNYWEAWVGKGASGFETIRGTAIVFDTWTQLKLSINSGYAFSFEINNVLISTVIFFSFFLSFFHLHV